MKATFNGVTIAESDETVVVEGNHYFPPESVERAHLSPTRMRTLCPWKGLAIYYSVTAAGSTSKNAAWTYRRPLPWIRKIRGHVAFWGDVEIRA
jgi:uncharacterized protein (DUF427 family)